MTDVRSLLRSHQQSTAASRISHPFAAYNAAGALRCTACGIAVKATAWDGHIGSKAHRKRAAALRVEEETRANKRKGLEQDDDAVDGRDGKKRRVEDVEMETSAVDAEPASSSGFPAGFFSDPSRAPPPREPSPVPSAEGGDVTMSAVPAPEALTAMDLEWESFQRAVLAQPPPPSDPFTRATIAAEPELLLPELPEGFPTSLQPVVDQQRLAVQTATGEAPSDKQETEEEKRARKAAEEKELIMDRILDEERAQEEADERVTTLKAKLEALKKARREKTGKKSA